MKRLLTGLLLAVLVALPLGVAVLVWFAVEDQALVADKLVLGPSDIERAKLLLKRNDPRAMRAGVLRSIVVPQQDVSLGAAYLASRFARGSARVVLLSGGALVRASFELPRNPLGRFLNVDLALTESARWPRVESAQIGRVALPPFICNWLLERGLARLQQHADYSAAADVIKEVHMRDGVLRVVFEWSEAAASQIKATLVPVQDQERWKAYQARLVELAAGAGARGARVPMEQLLTPLMQLAAQRSASGDAAAEGRAALVVLAFYINGKGLAALVPTHGHTPGHCSVRISSQGQEALITGDFLHHPCQMARLDWASTADGDPEAAGATRQRMFGDLAGKPVLVIGTHFAGPTAGHVVRDGAAYRLVV